MKFKVYKEDRAVDNSYNLDLNDEKVLSGKSIETITTAIKDYLEIYNRE